MLVTRVTFFDSVVYLMLLLLCADCLKRSFCFYVELCGVLPFYIVIALTGECCHLFWSPVSICVAWLLLFILLIAFFVSHLSRCSYIQ